MPVRRPAQETARLGVEIYERESAPMWRRPIADGTWHRRRQRKLGYRRRHSRPGEDLRAEHPQAVDVWLLRVGYRAIASIGGGSLRSAE